MNLERKKEVLPTKVSRPTQEERSVLGKPTQSSAASASGLASSSLAAAVSSF